MIERQRVDLLLRGKVVGPDGDANDRYLLVRDGVIDTISRQRPALVGDIPSLDLGPDDWIFPGLLDLHSHTTYNLYPIWSNRDAPYDNRFDWRNDPKYKQDISAVNRWFTRPGNPARNNARQRLIAVFSELQAIAGGTTVLQENYDLTSGRRAGETVLCRSTANPAELGLPPGQTVQSVLQFFSPKDGKPKPDERKIAAYLTQRDQGKLGATLVHLAEGRSGFDTADAAAPDPYTRAEFEEFMAHPAFRDPRKVKQSPLALIHGCGIDVSNEEQLAFLRDRAISVVWSPVSNLLLYWQTIDMEKIVLSGINVALGSDWSPSGSKHVWDEAKFARFYLSALGSEVSDAQIFQMVTTNAARCIGSSRLGRLEEGAFADMMIVRSPIESDNALEVFFKTMDRDVVAVLVGGVPRYGSREVLDQVQDYEWQKLSTREGLAVAGKRVYLPPHLKNEQGKPIDAAKDLEHLEDVLKGHESEIMRSNMLASSDRPYRRQIKDLRAFTVQYGWGVEQSQYYWKRFLP